jgi:S-adenosylmethionine-diacylglycerol 3-amino-3-carboxypropyl transferase
MNALQDNWVESACRQPIAFSQVREDPELDLHMLRMLGENNRVVMIASGGCTACSLLLSGRVAELYLVDSNPAQLTLCALKLRLLQCDPAVRKQVLGHAGMSPESREQTVEALVRELDLDIAHLGARETWTTSGLDHCGRYELLFQALRQTWGKAPEKLSSEQRAEGFSTVMALPILVKLFGSEATANAVTDFHRHFHQQTEAVLLEDPEMEGPFLSQMLRGRYTEAGHPWHTAPITGIDGVVHFRNEPMFDVLASVETDSMDMVHLSNILDWLTPEQARATLHESARVLRSGGVVTVRQLNSRLAIRELSTPGRESFRWMDELSAELLAQDRSFFYRDFVVGKKLP